MTDYTPSMSQVEVWLNEPLYVTEAEIGKLRQLYSIDERRLQRLVQQIAADVAQNLQVLAKPEPEGLLADTHYEWELEDAEGEWQAGGPSNSQRDVEREGMRYLQTYAQDGPHKLIIRQYTTQTINEIIND